MAIRTAQGADGRNTGDVLPKADSVTGSPFTVTGTSTSTSEELTGLVMISVQTNPIHVRFDRQAAVAADANDMLLPVGIHRFPVDGHFLSMIQDGAAATVYVELAEEVSS